MTHATSLTEASSISLKTAVATLHTLAAHLQEAPQPQKRPPDYRHLQLGIHQALAQCTPFHARHTRDLHWGTKYGLPTPPPPDRHPTMFVMDWQIAKVVVFGVWVGGPCIWSAGLRSRPSEGPPSPTPPPDAPAPLLRWPLR